MDVPPPGLPRAALAVAVALLLSSCSSPSPVADAGADGGTAACEPPQAPCGDRCVNVQTDARNCGGCGTECETGTFCDMAMCRATCSGGLTPCGSSCVDLVTDRAHCGSCDSPCEADEDCRGGGCTCPLGYTECGGSCVDPEVDPQHCGVCDRSCGPDEACNMGSCGCAAGARETECDDGADDDCDEMIDCADDDCVGATRGCEGMCGMGLETCGASGTWGACEGGSGGAEICGDGIDQDCDGEDPRNPDDYEPNDECDSCFLLSGTDPMTTITARFDSVDDRVDCFAFGVSDDCCGREFVTVDLTGVPETHDYDVYLYRSYEDCVARNAAASGILGGSADEHLSWGERFALSDSGTFYVRVTRFRGHSCEDDYSLAIDGLREMPLAAP